MNNKGSTVRIAASQRAVVVGGNVKGGEAKNHQLGEYAISEIGLFVVLCFGMVLFAQSLADPAFLLGVVIDVSSVMVGFGGLTAIFLVQTPLEAERHAASQYLVLCLEVQKAKSNTTETSTPSNLMLTDPLGPTRQAIDRLEIMMRDERNFRRLSLQLSIVVILSFTLSLLTSVIVAAGSWNITWLPMAFFLLGFTNYPVVLLLFVLYLYTQSERPERQLKELTK